VPATVEDAGVVEVARGRRSARERRMVGRRGVVRCGLGRRLEGSLWG